MGLVSVNVMLKRDSKGVSEDKEETSKDKALAYFDIRKMGS